MFARSPYEGILARAMLWTSADPGPCRRTATMRIAGEWMQQLGPKHIWQRVDRFGFSGALGPTQACKTCVLIRLSRGLLWHGPASTWARSPSMRFRSVSGTEGPWSWQRSILAGNWRTGTLTKLPHLGSHQGFRHVGAE